MKTAKRAKVVPNKHSHVVCQGNQRVIRASREAIGAMKYKAE